MRSNKLQMSLNDTYNDVCLTMETKKSEFLLLLQEHIKLREFISNEFYLAFYRRNGRPRDYSLESFMWFFILQKTLGIEKDSTLLNVLRMCARSEEPRLNSSH